MRRPSFVVLLSLAACEGERAGAPVTTAPDADAVSAADGDTAAPGGDDLPGTYLPPDPQRTGDPAHGFAVLAAGAYVGCGIPSELVPIAESAGVFGNDPPLPGRDDDLPYYLSRFDTPAGVEVVGPNCMICHANVGVDGQVGIGLPGIDVDFGGFAAQVAGFQGQVELLADVLSPAAYAELTKFADRLTAIAPYVQTDVAGVNTADNLAGILFSHRDPVTLAWSDTPLIDPPEKIVAAVDPPPWWRMKKKSTMFYTALGRGDHGRIMMTSSTLCIDTVADAERIDADFDDVRAYIASLDAPAWPEDRLGPIDRALAATGRGLFEANCAKCHGSYGASDAEDTYPNRWVTLDEVGTDPLLAVGASHVATRFVAWFNGSWYGQAAHLVPEPGYVPPPLDGIWATAPFFHNGSVPTLAQVLDPDARPTYWKREAGFDADGVGNAWKASPVGHDQLSGPGKRVVYDTTLLGLGNGGHDYGAALTPDERRAVLEYLKTL
ncbi:MAG: c-type cytochrome [Myxococcota bacterium]